jgi:hypothetical protein
MNHNTIMLADFHLDGSKIYLHNYQLNSYFGMFDVELYEKNLMQLFNFPAWSRTVNGVWRVHATEPTLIDELSSIVPYFKDHIIMHSKYQDEKAVPKQNFKKKT